MTRILIMLAALLPLTVQAAGNYSIHCGTLLDVEDRNVLRDQRILVRDGVIAEIGRSVNAPQGTRTIDLSDQVCAPGLMDMHVHIFIDSTRNTIDVGRLLQSSAYNTLMGLRNLQTLLDIGFTTIRITGDMGQYYEAVELKHAFERGEFTGPRMKVAPHALSPLGGHGDANSYAVDAGIALRPNIADGEDEIRKMVRRQIKYGADWIKIMASGGVMSQHDDPRVAAYTQEEFIAYADETHRHRKKITAHVHGDEGARMAVLAGFDSLEHGTMLEVETLELMAEQGTWLVPTRYVLDWILERGQSAGITANNLAKAQMVSDSHAGVVRMARRLGVRMALGSDPIFPMREAVREFSSMARILEDNWYVLQMGTIFAARMIETDELTGSLKAGKLADIVAMPRNPVDDIEAVEEVSFVMKGGEIVRQD